MRSVLQNGGRRTPDVAFVAVRLDFEGVDAAPAVRDVAALGALRFAVRAEILRRQLNVVGQQIGAAISSEYALLELRVKDVQRLALGAVRERDAGNASVKAVYSSANMAYTGACSAESARLRCTRDACY